MKVDILITSFCRPEHLRWNLHTLLGQGLNQDYQVTILNDGFEDDTINVVNSYKDKGLRIRYLFTGKRNRSGLKWRCPGFALNIGIRQSEADIVILTCAEIYHLNNSVEAVVTPVRTNSFALGTPCKVYWDDSELLGHLSSVDLKLDEIVGKLEVINNGGNSLMPFFMAINRQKLLDIGGYDEDFIGKAADDNDLIDRLLATGCKYAFTPAEVVHLFHGCHNTAKLQSLPEYKYNVQLWKSRRGQNIRNVGREWGVL
jgi:GT2 family glycosyltransferase